MFAISDWTVTEFASAVGIKVRTGQLDKSQAASVLACFLDVAGRSLRVLVVGLIS